MFDFEETEFELAGRQWQIHPLLAIPAKKIFYQHVRPCLAVMGDLQITTRHEDGSESSLNQGQIILGIIGRIPQNHLDALSTILVDKCLWVKDDKDAGKYHPVSRDKEAAFKNMKVSELAMLDARLFAVNFGPSVSDLIALFQAPVEMDVDTAPSKRKTRTRSS